MRVEIVSTAVESSALVVKALVFRDAKDPRCTDMRAELLALRDEITRMLAPPTLTFTMGLVSTVRTDTVNVTNKGGIYGGTLEKNVKPKPSAKPARKGKAK